ncbi:hypothetical protein N9139_02185 [Akkermansiaceae bacterium]|nr:hypothetical protein [Akkermansiaceae bacterium]
MSSLLLVPSLVYEEDVIRNLISDVGVPADDHGESLLVTMTLPKEA